MNKKPLISLIIPVLNEATCINTLISHLRAIDCSTPVEIIVVDGNPVGSTIKAVEDHSVKLSLAAQGRARQMNRGAKLAAGNILLFLHADTFLPHKAPSLITEALSSDEYAGGAFSLGIGSRKKIFRITEVYTALRTKITRIPFGDQAFFIRKDYFEEIGGFKEIPVMEDVDLMGRIKKMGDRIVILPQKVLTSPRRYEQEGIVRCTFRNLALQIAYALGVSPRRLAGWYRDH